MDKLRKELIKENALLWIITVVLVPLFVTTLQSGDNTTATIVASIITVVILIKYLTDEEGEKEKIIHTVTEASNSRILGLEVLEKKEGEDDE